jgi:hypothetical protein
VAFPSKTNIIGFEAGSLTGLSLFLDGFDFHNFFLQAASQEFVNNFLFFDGDGESEDINNIVNESTLD